MKEILNQETIQKILKRVTSKKASDPLFIELLVMTNPITTMACRQTQILATGVDFRYCNPERKFYTLYIKATK